MKEFDHWQDLDSSDPQYKANPREVNLIGEDKYIFGVYEGEVSEVTYKPSETTIVVHSAITTELVASPTEIGTVVNPAEVGTEISITATLTDIDGNPIAGKTLHCYYPDGTEIGTGLTTDANGQVIFTYVVRAEDDGQSLTIKYLGD